MNIKPILQPRNSSTVQRIGECIEANDVQKMDVAVAYITASGLALLLDRIENSRLKGHALSRIRWITAFDYLRTDPVALSEIRKLDKKRIRVYDAEASLKRQCMPIRPFHPKFFLFDSTTTRALVVGSGNLSFSGLSRGVEAGLSLAVPKNGEIAQYASNALRSYANWYTQLWRESELITDDVLSRYTDQYDSVPNLKNPPISEDDVIPQSELNSGLSLKELARIRSARRYWVNTKNITKNRGRNLAGNQLMLKRMSRVFFGCPAKDVKPDTRLRDLLIQYGDHPPKHCTLSFSNNKMDKVTLPIPNDGGPPSYDNATIQFERITSSLFAVRILNAHEKKQAKAASKKIDALFKLKGGRQWGVF